MGNDARNVDALIRSCLLVYRPVKAIAENSFVRPSMYLVLPCFVMIDLRLYLIKFYVLRTTM